MELQRLGSPVHSQTENDIFPDDDHNVVRVFFRNFGTKLQESYPFRVNFNWEDVETLIAKFAYLKHPEAVQLLRDRSQARAAHDGSGSPPDAGA